MLLAGAWYLVPTDLGGLCFASGCDVNVSRCVRDSAPPTWIPTHFALDGALRRTERCTGPFQWSCWQNWPNCIHGDKHRWSPRRSIELQARLTRCWLLAVLRPGRWSDYGSKLLDQTMCDRKLLGRLVALVSLIACFVGSSLIQWFCISGARRSHTQAAYDDCGCARFETCYSQPVWASLRPSTSIETMLYCCVRWPPVLLRASAAEISHMRV